MKGNERVKTPQLADGDSTLDEVSTVIILDTFILALFSIVMFGTALVLIATHNGFLSLHPREDVHKERNPAYTLALVERPQFAANPCGENSFWFAGPTGSDPQGASARPGLIDNGSMFTLQRSSRARSAPHGVAIQPNSIRNAGSVVAEEKIRDHEPLAQEQAVTEQTGSGGSYMWNDTGELYDGYAISTIINNP